MLLFVGGLIQVYVGDLQYKPIVWAVDKKPIPVKYVSFASNDGSRVLFFYNCDDNTSDTIDLATAPVHPLLAAPSVYDEEILASKCKHVHAWENKYTLGVNLAALKKSQPDEYVFQIPIYIRGIRDAHILLTPSGDLNPENGYEIRKCCLKLKFFGSISNDFLFNNFGFSFVTQFSVVGAIHAH